MDYPRGCRQTSSEQMLEMGIDPLGELRDLGYEYRGRSLRQLGSGEAFQFQTVQHYDQLADSVVNYVGLLLEDEADLRPLFLPLGADPGEGCPIYVSDGFEKAQRLLLIIGGAGRVRAGVWGCGLCINRDFNWGTALPYLHMAVEKGYGVVVLNPNQRNCDGGAVPGSETAERHVNYVMENVISAHCEASDLDVVAHSCGGKALVGYLRLAGSSDAGAWRKIRHIVFTDSYHTKNQLSFLRASAKDLLADPLRTVNFVPHAAALGTPVETWCTQDYCMAQSEKGCLCLSAGVEDHASTNHAVLHEAFRFFKPPKPEYASSDARMQNPAARSPTSCRDSAWQQNRRDSPKTTVLQGGLDHQGVQLAKLTAALSTLVGGSFGFLGLPSSSPSTPTSKARGDFQCNGCKAEDDVEEILVCHTRSAMAVPDEPPVPCA